MMSSRDFLFPFPILGLGLGFGLGLVFSRLVTTLKAAVHQ